MTFNFLVVLFLLLDGHLVIKVLDEFEDLFLVGGEGVNLTHQGAIVKALKNIEHLRWVELFCILSKELKS
jgi:hypothetical protein